MVPNQVEAACSGTCSHKVLEEKNTFEENLQDLVCIIARAEIERLAYSIIDRPAK